MCYFYFDFISKCLTHDGIFVKLALDKLFSSNLFKSFKLNSLKIWSDNAKHFKNKILLYNLGRLQELYFPKGIEQWFFEAYHGKSLVDGHFGNISQWIKKYTLNNYINSSDDLLKCFQKYNSKSKKKVFSIIFDPAPFYWNISHFQFSSSFTIKNKNGFSYYYGIFFYRNILHTFKNNEIIFSGFKIQKYEKT